METESGGTTGVFSVADKVLLLLCLAAGIGCWLPAQRAARVDPMDALRTE